jgi:membrane protease YdiL (CAAX protease family)
MDTAAIRASKDALKGKAESKVVIANIREHNLTQLAEGSKAVKIVFPTFQRRGQPTIMGQNFDSSATAETQEIQVTSPFVVWLKRYQLFAFFALAFAITWGLWFFLIASQAGILPLKLAANSPAAMLLFRLAGWGPAVSALVLTPLVSGKRGMREFFSRLVLWRVGLQWYAVTLFRVQIVVLAVVGLYILLVGPLPGSPLLATWYAPILEFLPMLLLGVALVGFPEEAGWRGYALPRLLSRYTPFTASLLLGIIWGLWHLPLYTIIYPYGLAGFLLFLLRTVALSVLITWVYLHTKRSLLISILFHSAIDTSTGIFLTSVAATGFSGVPFTIVNALYTGLLWVAVAIIVAISGLRLSRKAQAEQIEQRKQSEKPS